MAKQYNIFISHSWTYGDAYDRLSEMLKKKPYFNYKDFSVPKDDPVHTSGTDKELYEAIKNKISLTSVVIIMAGKYSTFSKWIKKEIKISKEEFEENKKILAITPWGAEQISSTVKENADKIVGWNTDSIVDGIRELVHNGNT